MKLLDKKSAKAMKMDLEINLNKKTRTIILRKWKLKKKKKKKNKGCIRWCKWKYITWFEVKCKWNCQPKYLSTTISLYNRPSSNELSNGCTNENKPSNRNKKC